MKKHLMLAVFASLLAVGANAQTAGGGAGPGSGSQPGARRGGPCKADIQALCPGQRQPQAMACLAANLDKIQNATCKAGVEKFQANDNAVKQACSSDIASDKCSGMDIGTGLLKCLADNKKTLSAGCKTELKTLRQSRRGRGRNGGKGSTAGQGSQAGGGSSDEPGDDDSGQ